MKQWVILSCLILGGCQFVGLITNGAHRVYSMVADERSSTDDWSDVQINMAVRDALGKCRASLMIDIEVTVFEGEVLLTGAIPSAESLNEALSAVWSVSGVRKVYNYVRIDETPSFRDSTLEAAVAAKIKAKLAVTADVQAPNYKLILENGTVYLMGIYEDEAEYNRVLAVLKTTEGVEKVVTLMHPSLGE